MKTNKNVKIKNESEEPVTVEVIAESLVTMSEGMKKLMNGKLNEKAIYLLIQHASPSTGWKNKKPTIEEIKSIITGIESLAETYLKKTAR